jgi:MoaA/NifB/PqqE/SkfB family radical SAM enzyme
LVLKAGFGHSVEGMAQSDFARILSWFQPKWDWVQAEVTTDCNAACIYCPRTVYRNSWKDRHLPLETFKKLRPVMGRTHHFHLQGWGEPLLHPDFFEMVAIGKAAGCHVGTTTNGMLINVERIERVVQSELDIIAFSLAGTGEENDRIRKGTSLTKVIEVIRSLRREKEKQGTTKPAIHVAYMLFRSGVVGLGNLPRLLQGSGVSDVVISFLDFVPSDELLREVIAPATGSERDELRSLLRAVKEEGDRHGLRIHQPLESVGYEGGVCTENVLRAICIASDGSVTPCVYTNLEAHRASYFLAGEKRLYERMIFGNIKERSVNQIWRQKAYRAFRRSFRAGQLAAPCRGCPKLRRT